MRLALVFSLLLGLLSAPLLATAEVLVLGSVNDNVRKHVDRMSPMARYLERELGDLGITEVQIKVVPTTSDISAEIREGNVHLYFDSPLVAANVARSSGAVPFLRRWKRGVASYHSLIIVPADSAFHTLEDLAGHRIGFQEPDSTSGFMLPVGMIHSQGLATRELSSRTSSPGANEIGYVFTGDDKNTLLWLAKGWIDAGATDPRSWKQLQEARPGAFRVIAKSIEVPRHVVLRAPDMDAAMVARISALLQSLHETEEGEAILKKFHKTTRFDEFPRGIEATFEPINALLDELAAAGLS